MENQKKKEIAENIASLILHKNELSDEKIQELLSDKSAIRVISNLSDDKILAEKVSQFYKIDKFKNNRRLLQAIHRRKIMILFFRVSVVAAIFIVGLFGSNYLKNSQQTEAPVSFFSEIAPSKNLPTIVLADGKQIVLTEAFQNKNVEIITNTQAMPKNQEFSENTIIVPRGTTFRFILPDSTAVTLNSGSELTYPTNYSMTNRHVRLQGEAYFEVTKSGSPFTVTVNDLKVKVYGTKFNVEGYASETIKTFLVQGSIGLRFRDNDEVLLLPNEVALTNISDENTVVKKGSAEKYLSWINGYFMYDNEPLIDVINDLSKFYDVEFIIENDSIVRQRTVASFDRNKSLIKILNMLEKATGIQFRQEERRFYIY